MEPSAIWQVMEHVSFESTTNVAFGDQLLAEFGRDLILAFRNKIEPHNRLPELTPSPTQLKPRV